MSTPNRGEALCRRESHKKLLALPHLGRAIITIGQHQWQTTRVERRAEAGQRTERRFILSMITCIQLKHSDAIQQLRDDYLRTLVAPMDGMWESTVIAQATFWEIQDREQHAGYFCIGSDNELLRFHLWENYQDRAQEIFRWIVSTYGIQHAIVSTIEPLYFSLCLDIQRSITLHSYLFRDNQRKDLSSGLGKSIFRKAEKSELDDMVRFYQANTEGSGEWIETFLNAHLNREELFVLYDQHTLVAAGECIPSQKQLPYADLGMVVARSYRGRGVGSFLLTQLKKHCYEAGWKPICSCEVSNRASKKAIEKAGFLSEQRMVKITFSRDELITFPF
jgi:GNAT superfamily N-acetyltransferase